MSNMRFTYWVPIAGLVMAVLNAIALIFAAMAGEVIETVYLAFVVAFYFAISLLAAGVASQSEES